MAELKPCPFCGGEAKYINGINQQWVPAKAFCRVSCSKCKASTRDFSDHGGDFVYKDSATEAWNRRYEPQGEIEFDYGAEVE